MPSFGKLHEAAQRNVWKEHYLPYKQLKSIFEQFATRRSSLDESVITCHSGYLEEDTNVVERLYDLESTILNDFKGIFKSRQKRERYLAFVEKEEFCYVLDSAIQSIGHFYLEQVDRLTSWLDDLNSKREGLDYNDDDGTLIFTFDSYKPLVKELVELYLFVGVNVTALRQILIRYDCMVRTLNGPPLGQWYIVKRKGMARKQDELFEALFSRQKLILLSNKFTLSIIQRQEDYGMEISSQLSQIEMNIQSSERAVDVVMRDRWAIPDTLAFYFLAGSLLSDVMMVPSFIRTRGKTLSKEIAFFANWRANKSEIGLLPTERPKELKEIFTPPLLLNFTAQMFYMMSHYIIEPSSMNYIRELGGNDALSGLLIGMAPAAALLSAFGYSLWSNKSFREPLLFAGIFLIIGSITYASALKYQSIWMAMTGRFIQGLGAPCVMNIRHIADTVNATHRTAVSAMFTTVSAVGMSLGPGLAVLLDFFDMIFNVPFFGRVIVNGSTAPGYLMAFLWCIWYIGIYNFFVDEERIGLYEKTQGAPIYKPPIEIDDHQAQLKNSVSSDGMSIYEKTQGAPVYKPPIEIDDHQAQLKNSVSSDGMSIYVEESINQSIHEESAQGVNEATLVCMTLKFIGKFVLEILGCSVSIISIHRYNWSVRQIGSLSFVNGCLIIPISTLVGYLSQHYSDKNLLRGLLCVSLMGTILLFDLSDFVEDVNDYEYVEWQWAAVGPRRYVAGIILEFCGMQAAQSVVLSMLSKVIPLSLAEGTFNSGFITTCITTVSCCACLLFSIYNLITCISHKCYSVSACSSNR